MNAETAAALLEADALLPVKQKTKTRAEIDSISARSYAHPALPGPVVRLTADGLAQGEDLAMEFLGFAEPEVTGPVAQRKRQALGFPGWALINDPDHARYALELVKEFRKEVRRAKSKPGHGYDGIQAIAKKLNRSVAHFLPSFWEEAGRAFINYGNGTYASRCFGKAREAEKVHALKVDEDIRRSAFLEFALAGCLTIKALTEYSKELEASYGAEEAWGIYRELIVRRTLGGMPPWAAMAKDVKRIAKAASLDYDEQLKGLLREIIDSPAMGRAEMTFWKNCGGVVKTLAHDEPPIAKALLSMVPETSHWSSDAVWEWLELLDQWELLPIVYGEGNQQAAPDESAADWISKYCQASGSGRAHQRLHDLLPKIAGKLKENGAPIKPYAKRWGDYTCDVDLLDLALELGILVTDPPGDMTFDLNEWADVLSDDDCPENRPRDPIHLARDERFASALKDGVSSFAGNSAFEAAAAGKVALKEARREWIMALSAAANDEAIPGAGDAVDRLRNSTSRKTFVEFPAAYEVLKTSDISVALGNTLRAGILDEYGWPALEDAVEKLAPESKKELKCYGRLPHIVLSNGLLAIVIDRDGPILECELTVKKDHEIRSLDYYDGDLYVTLYNRSEYEAHGYWVSNPKKTLETSWRYSDAKPHGAVTVRAEGGWFNGAQTITRGDTKKIEDSEQFSSDGEHFWQITYENGYSDQVLREVDPANGKKGRKSMPSFFEDFIQEGHTLDFRQSTLVKIGEAVDNSPFGSKDGLIGWRVRDREDSWVRAEGIDGRVVEPPIGARANPGPAPVGMLDQPGTDQKLIVTGDSGWNSSYRTDIDIWSPDKKLKIAEIGKTGTAYYQGQAVLLMPLFWHLFQARDLKSSKKLRKLKDKEAAALIKAAREDLEQADGGTKGSVYKNLDAAIAKLLPGCNERLAHGLHGIVVRAARCKTELDGLIELRDPAVEEEETIADLDTEAFLTDALQKLNVGYSWGSVETLFGCLEETAQFFAGNRKADQHPTRVSFFWEGLLDRLDTKLWRAYWSSDEIHEGCEKLADAPWCKFLDVWRQCKINALPGKMRRLTAKLKKDAPFPLPDAEADDYDVWRFYEHKDSKYLFFCEDLEEIYEDDVLAIEYTEAKSFATPKNFSITEERQVQRVWTADQMDEFVKLIAEREPPYLSDELLQRLADGVGVPVAEAALVWCGFPNFDVWGKNFLPKPLRERLGLKVAEAQAARQSLQVMDEAVRDDILSALLDGPPVDLWDNPDVVVDRLIDQWSQVVPKRLDLPTPVLDQLENISGWGMEIGTIMTSLADPGNADIFRESSSSIDSEHSYSISIENDTSPSFDESALTVVVGAVATLYYDLPVGDPAREAATKAFDIAVERLKNPNLLLAIGTKHFEEKKKNPLGPEFLSRLGKLKKAQKYQELDDGALFGIADDTTAFLSFRPAKATTAKAIDRIRSAIGMFGDDSDEGPANDSFDELQILRSDGFKEMVKRIAKSPLDDGQYEANPLYSAPSVIAKAVKKYSLSEEAATLYLQTLTLYDCTTKKVREWNGWTAANYNKAAKELVAAKLVLEAKRSRAGRKHFLPGGWEALKAPHLPIESWKLPLYQAMCSSTGVAEFPMDRIICLMPCHKLFEDAWSRIESGDEPSYEEV